MAGVQPNSGVQRQQPPDRQSGSGVGCRYSRCLSTVRVVDPGRTNA